MKLRKTLSVLLIALLFLVLTPSCSSDDPIKDQTETPGKPIDPGEEPKEPTEPEEKPDLEDEDYLTYGKEFTMGGEVYPIESFKKEQIEEGFDLMSLSIYQIKKDPKFRLRAHVIRFERALLEKGYTLEAIMGGKTLTSYSNALQAVERENSSHKTLMATINADFFDMGNHGPVLGTMITDHNVIKIGGAGWQKVYGITNDNELFIDDLTFDVKADKATITNINSKRGENHLILYTQEMGERTGSNQYGSEIVLKPTEGLWGDLEDYTNVVCEVTQAATSTEGGEKIPEGHIVLSGHGTSAEICKQYKVGDKVNIQIQASGSNNKAYKNIRTAVGTPYEILVKGEVIPAATQSGNPNGREPRTAIGHSDKHIYMVVVEARNRQSFGFTTVELGEFMKFMGANDAVNLDGGGSTTLVTGNGNKTYGQGEDATFFRAVPNFLSLVKWNR